MRHTRFYLYTAYLLFFIIAIAILSPSTCQTLKERNKELDKLSGFFDTKVVMATTEEKFTLTQVQTEIRFAQDAHQQWLVFLENNPQWLKDHKDMVEQLPTLYSPEWHRYWVGVYVATLSYLKQVKELEK